MPTQSHKPDRSAVGTVYDRLRRKHVPATPEELVRQAFVDFLIDVRRYPEAFMANEVGLRLNGMIRRCDTVIYDRTAQPIAIVEYKAPDVNITQKVFDQIARYNMVLNARILIVSNGRRHYCCRYDSAAGSYTFLPDLPYYSEI